MAKSKQSKRQKKSLSVLEAHTDDESPESSPSSKESRIRRTRAAHRGAVTRLISKMDDLIPQADASASIVQQIRGCHERLTEKLGTLIQLDEEILQMMTDERRADEEIDILEYVDRVKEKLAEVKYLIETPQSTVQTSASPSGKVKLPKIALPLFDGKYTEWTSFWDQFQASVDADSSLSGSQKLNYLKSSLKGEAFKVVSSLSITDDNYPIACGLIRERYENKRCILRTRFQALYNYPTLRTEHSTALRKLHTVMHEHTSALSN